MNTKRNLTVLAIAAALSACAAPRERPQTPPAAVAPPPVAAPAPEPKPEPSDTVVILPLDQPAEAAPAPAPLPEPEAAPEPAPELELAHDAAEAMSQPAAMTDVVPAPQAEFAVPAPAPAAVPAAPVQAVPAPATSQPKPAGPRAVVADRAPREFTITVKEKIPSHPNYGRGHEIGFYVDGMPGEELVLSRGVTYIFHVRTDVQHDFYFTTSAKGRGAGTVADGVMGQFTYIGDVSFTPSASTPDLMYYECRNHAYMGGRIRIANAGDKVTIGGESRTVAAGAAARKAVSAQQVKQKLGFAEMMINGSPVATRVAGSGNAAAKKTLEQAREQIRVAQAALDAGKNADAMEAANEAVRLISEAGRRLPADGGVDYKARYAELLDQIQGFDKSYQKNVEKGVKPKSGKVLDRAAFDAVMREGRMYADREQYADAVKRLETANDMMTEALGALLQAQTVVYDKNFATPKEEYEFELARYDSYAELIPLAIEQRGPLPRTVEMMNKLSGRAQEIRDEGRALAAKGDHKQAIMALQAATDKLRQALRLAGVQ